MPARSTHGHRPPVGRVAERIDPAGEIESGAFHDVREAPAPPARASLTRLTRHLFEIGLVSAADVHRADLVASDAGMSHAVAVVTLGDGRGFVVKELLESGDASQGSPDQERGIYRLAARVPALAAFLAPVVDLGDGRPFIVLGLQDDESVASRVARTGWSDGQLGRFLGHALGTWHELSRPHAADLTRLPVPWVLRAIGPDRPTFLPSNVHVATFLDSLDAPTLGRHLAEGAAFWRASGVVHGDLRFDNCLIDPGGRATFVDWECAGLGDPLWDVATAVQELISASSARDATACVPVLTGAGRLLLEAYRASCPSESWVDGPVRLGFYTAARLLQRAFQLAARGRPELVDERDRHLGLAAALFAESVVADAVAAVLPAAPLRAGAGVGAAA